tara:strand:+ start:252 stop:884 length:633 start_codon:yes stop_codon:yes gene_type:complete
MELINASTYLDTSTTLSWVEQEEKLQNIDSVFSREPMSGISAKFIYMNTHDYIDKVVCENIPLSLFSDGSLLSKELFMQIIQKKKLLTSTSKYKFLDCYLCNFDIIPTYMNDFANITTDSDNATRFYKQILGFEDIFIPPSIFVFHDVNTLFFYFQETPFDEKPIVKSILKKNNSYNNKLTKKVRIQLSNKTNVRPNKKKRTTRRTRHDS